ncbi:unnamed protein product, partial [Rotaria sp. Silwood1]
HTSALNEDELIGKFQNLYPTGDT